MDIYTEGACAEKKLFIVPNDSEEGRELEKFCKPGTPLTADIQEAGSYRFPYLIIRKVKP